MNLSKRWRLARLPALAGLATISLTSACTYDFDQFEGLGPPVGEEEAGQGGHAGAGGADAGKDASIDGDRDGSTNTGGSGQGGSGGSGGSGATGGSGGATGGTGGTTGGNGGTAGKGGTAGSGGSSGSGGSAGTGGAGTGGATGGTGGATGGTGGTTGGTGGTGGATGGTGGATGGTGGSGGTTGGSGGTGGSAGSGGTGGTPPADASDVRDAQADRAVDVAPDASFDCGSVGGTVYQGHCYYAVSVAVDWNTAATTCESPAHLVTITSAGEQNVVKALLSDQDRWIGMRRPANSAKVESSFYWVTNEAISYRAWDVYSDADKEPNYTGECVRMRFTGLWADDACTNALAVICERE
jgi:hypothetical protein